MHRFHHNIYMEMETNFMRDESTPWSSPGVICEWKKTKTSTPCTCQHNVKTSIRLRTSGIMLSMTFRKKYPEKLIWLSDNYTFHTDCMMLSNDPQPSHQDPIVHSTMLVVHNTYVYFAMFYKLDSFNFALFILIMCCCCLIICLACFVMIIWFSATWFIWICIWF